MCAKDKSYFVESYCQKATDFKDEFIYPACFEQRVKPTILGNDIFNTKIFLVICTLMYLIYLAFYLKQ
jgi:hypothetical protein